MKVISKMREWWNNYWALRHAYGIRLHIFRIIDARARLHFFLPGRGTDKIVDHNIEDARKSFIFGGESKAEIKEPLPAQLMENYRAIEIYRWLCSDAKAKSDRALYLRALHFERTAEDSSLAETSAHLYQDFYQEELQPIDAPMLKEKYSALVTRFRTVQLALVQMINVELKYFAQIAPIPSAVFVIFGYVHTSIVYGHFGINASQFFTLGDYLAGSINQIWIALLAIFGYLIAVIYMYRRRIKFVPEFPSDFSLKITALKIPSRTFFVRQSVVLIFLSAIILFYICESNAFWYFLPLSLLFFQDWVARAVSRVFKNPFQMTAVAMLALLFAASIFSQSMGKIENIERNSERKFFLVETAEKTFTDEDSVFLGGNQRYIFLLKSDGGAEIIPRENVKKMNIQELKTWRVPFMPWLHRGRLFLRDLPGKIGTLHFW